MYVWSTFHKAIAGAGQPSQPPVFFNDGLAFMFETRCVYFMCMCLCVFLKCTVCVYVCMEANTFQFYTCKFSYINENKQSYDTYIHLSATCWRLPRGPRRHQGVCRSGTRRSAGPSTRCPSCSPGKSIRPYKHTRPDPLIIFDNQIKISFSFT